MNIIELLEEKRRGLTAVLQSLETLDKSGHLRERYGETLAGMKTIIQKLDSEIRKIVKDPVRADLPSFVTTYVTMKQFITECNASLPQKGARRTATQKLVSKYNTQLETAFRDLDKSCGDELCRSLADIDRQRKLYADEPAFMADVNKQKQTFGLFGKKPTMAECTYMTLSNSEPARVFNALLWLSRNEDALNHSIKDRTVIDNHPFHKAYLRLLTSVAEAPADKQAKLAQLLVRQEVVTGDAAKQDLDKFMNASRAAAVEAKRTEAYANLANTEAYRSFESLKAIRDSLGGTMLAAMMDRCSLGEAKGKPGIGQRNKEIRTLASGGLKVYLKDEEGAAYADEFKTNYDRGVLIANGCIPGGRAWENYDLYNRMREKHTHDASDTYRGMERVMGRLADVDPEAQDKTEYLRRLREAEKASRAYLNTHRKVPYTQIGKDRVALAKELHDYAVAAIDSIDVGIAGRQHKQAEYELNNAQEVTHESLMQIGRLQRTIGTSHINPPQPKMKDGISSFKKSGVGHVLYGSTHWLLNNTMGRAWELITLPFSHYSKEKTINTSLDTTLIPGTKDKHFEQIDVNNLPDNQPMITDPRRVPLVWEHPIPEDPNQPPTVTLEIEQPREGDAVGNAASEGKRKVGEMGHGFVRLNYTKKDPVTGQLQRYRTTFGFYPKGGFLSTSATTAMYAEGLYIPGQLTDDNGHDTTVGKTFTINNKQFNQIVTAAEKYEKDGYNYFKRNCTTFVHDMADAAGLDTGSLFRKVDLTSEDIATNVGGVGLNLFGLAAPFGHFARRDIVSKAGKDDLTYQRFGQKMVNTEDIQRFKRSGFYFRAKGYAPGHAGESFRYDKDFKLHSMSYDGSKKNALTIMKENSQRGSVEDFMEKHDPGMYYPDMINLEFNDLCEAIRNLPDYDDHADKETMERFGKYHMTMSDTIKMNAMLGLETNVQDFAATKNHLINGADAVNQYIDGLNEIYRDSFKSDPRLNIPFQHLVSVLEKMREAFYDSYENLYANCERKDVSPEKLGLSCEDRDLPRSAMLMFNEQNSYTLPTKGHTDMPITPVMIASGVRVMGSLDEYLKIAGEYYTLNKKKKEDTLTDAEKSALRKCELKCKIVDSFASAEKGFCEPHLPTEEEIRFAFRTLPDEETDNLTTEEASMHYQEIIFDHMFSGLLPKMRDIVRQSNHDFGDVLTTPKETDFKTIEFSKKSPEEKEALKQAQSEFERKKDEFVTLVGNMVSRHIQEKLNDPDIADRFRMIKEQSAVRYIANMTGDVNPHDSYDEMPERYKDMAEAHAYGLLTERFVNMVCSEIGYDAKPEKQFKCTPDEKRRAEFFTFTLDSSIFPRAAELDRAERARQEAENRAAREEIRLREEAKVRQALPQDVPKSEVGEQQAAKVKNRRRSVSLKNVRSEGSDLPDEHPEDGRKSVGKPTVKKEPSAGDK